jgi:hypothetical protein
LSGRFNSKSNRQERGFSTSTINLESVKQVQSNMFTFKQSTEWQEIGFLTSTINFKSSRYVLKLHSLNKDSI